MTWIETRVPDGTDPELAGALERGLAAYPSEYAPERSAEMRVPASVAADSIVLAHSLIPRALEHVFAAFAAMMDPALPLTRRQHEMIATVVSVQNQCFY